VTGMPKFTSEKYHEYNLNRILGIWSTTQRSLPVFALCRAFRERDQCLIQYKQIEYTSQSLYIPST
jgi:hypothetical protein